MTVSELRKQLEILEGLGEGDMKIGVEGEYGFTFKATEMVVFDDQVVIEREE